MRFIIATPVFNGMPALRRCVGSVHGQAATEPLKSLNVETPDGSLNGASTSTCNDLNGINDREAICVQHIVQDGGSSDGTVDWLRQYDGEINSQILDVSEASPKTYSFTFFSEKDEGMYDAINRAWAKADGDVLCWLNSDEQYLPGTLQKVADYFEKHPDVDAVFGNTIITTSTGAPYAARKEIPLRKIYVANGFLYALSCSTFFRRTLWDSGLLKLDTQYRYSADIDLVLRLLSAGVRFGHMDDFLALFGVEEGRNLSFRPEMALETAAIQKRYGALPLRVMRAFIMGARYAERMFRGCYRLVPVSYRYAMDEKPMYYEYNNPELGFRFTYSRFSEESVSCDREAKEKTGRSKKS